MLISNVILAVIVMLLLVALFIAVFFQGARTALISLAITSVAVVLVLLRMADVIP